MRKLKANRGHLRFWVPYCLGVGYAALSGTPGCNSILGNEPGQLAAETGGADAIAGGDSHAGGGSIAGGGSHAGGGSSATAGSSSGGTGAKAGAGGAPSPGGAGGTAGRAGTGGGTTAGAAGGGTVCTNPPLIDDFEDGENTLAPCGGRIGYWFVYNDKGQTDSLGVASTCMQLPPAQPSTGGIPFPPTAGGTVGSTYAAHTSGSGCTAFGAGIGFDFLNDKDVSTPFDAHKYQGISFAVKGSLSTGNDLRVEVTIPSTTLKTEPGGTCVATTALPCDDHFQIHLTPPSSWLYYQVVFNDTVHFAQIGFGKAATFDPSQLLGMRFQAPVNTTFDFWIDDVTFF